jgi:VCBS repeat-containing protein
MKRMLRQILKSSLLILFLVGLNGSEALAQVVVTFPSISGSPGQTVTVPVSISNVPGTGFTSLQFDIVASSNAVVFKGGFSTATLVQNAGWTFASNSVANGDLRNRVAAFGSSQSPITTSGILVYLQFEIGSLASGVTVQLTKFTLKLGADSVPVTPVIPSTSLNANSSPVAVADAYQVNEGATLTVAVGTGVLANDTDADGDPLTATVGVTTVNGALTLAADGSFSYVHNGSETTTDTFTYSVSDGSTTAVGNVSITIVPVNDSPIFTQVIANQSVDEGVLVSGDYDATDAEGSTLVFALVSGPAGAAINPATGEFGFLTSTGGAGVYTITVSVSDGSATTQSSFTLTVRSVVKYSGTLSGAHQISIVKTSATGSIAADYATNTKELIISGSFSGLSSTMVSAQVLIGSTTEAGEGIMALSATLVGNGSSGNFAAASNMFDLSTFSFPSGWNVTLFEQALATGNVYVNLSSLGILAGELRTQLRLLTNTAPPAVNVTGPSSVAVTGLPAANAYDLTWQPGSADGQGDVTKLVLESASDVLFGTVLSVTDVTAAANSSVSFTIDASAKLYDLLSGSTPGNVSLGGTKSIYYRLKRTDGSALSTGSPIGVVLTRGLVTDKETESSLPAEFVLLGNYPNPFNPTTTIQFDLPESADVQIDVLDLLGRTMISIPSQSIEAGAKKSISVDASELSSGIYMYRVMVRTAKQAHFSTGTMTLIK